MTGGNIAKGGAFYEAELIDNVTGPVEDIIKSLEKLEEAFKGVAGPAKEVSDAMGNINKGGNKAANAINKQSSIINSSLKTLTKFRTAALSVGQGVSQGLNSAASAFKALGTAMLAFSAAATFAIKKLLDLAGAAQETESRFNIIFGKSAGDAQRWASDLSGAIGRSETAIKDFSATFQTLFVGFGFAERSAAALSFAMTELALDLASFNNVADEDAMMRLRSGLTGSTEALERFGINTKASAIDEKLFQMGLSRTNKDLNERSKVLARMLVVLDATQKQQDDVLRTMTSWENQSKSLRAALRTTFEGLGKAIQDELIGPLGSLVKIFRALGELAPEIGSDIVKSFLSAVAVAGALGAAFVATGVALTALAGLVITVSTALSGLAAILSLGLASPILAIALAVGGLSTAIVGLSAATTAWQNTDLPSTLSNLQSGFTEVFDTIVTGFDRVAEAMQSGDMDAAFKALTLTAKSAFYDLSATLAEELQKAIDSVTFQGLIQNIVLNISRGLTGVRDVPGAEPDLGRAGNYARAARAAADALNEELEAMPAGDTRTDRERERDALAAASRRRAWAAYIAEQQLLTEQANQDFVDALHRDSMAIEAHAKKFEEIEALTKSVRTPLEILADTMTEIASYGADLDPETRRRLEAQAIEKYQKAIASGVKKTVEKAVKGPGLATSSGFFAGQAGGRAGRFAPSVNPVLAESKKQTKLQKQIAENTKKAVPAPVAAAAAAPVFI